MDRSLPVHPGDWRILSLTGGFGGLIWQEGASYLNKRNFNVIWDFLWYGKHGRPIALSLSNTTDVSMVWIRLDDSGCPKHKVNLVRTEADEGRGTYRATTMRRRSQKKSAEKAKSVRRSWTIPETPAEDWRNQTNQRSWRHHNSEPRWRRYHTKQTLLPMEFPLSKWPRLFLKRLTCCLLKRKEKYRETISVGTVIPMAIGNTVLKHTRMDGGSEWDKNPLLPGR